MKVSLGLAGLWPACPVPSPPRPLGQLLHTLEASHSRPFSGIKGTIEEASEGVRAGWGRGGILETASLRVT